MAAQALTAAVLSAEAKQPASGSNAGARETESSFSATLSEQRAHHQSSSTSAPSKTPDAESDRPRNHGNPGDAGKPQDKKHAPNQGTSQPGDKTADKPGDKPAETDQTAAGKPETDHDHTQVNHTQGNTATGNQVASGEPPHHAPLPANVARTSNADLNGRGEQRAGKAPHPDTGREHPPRHETAQHRTILETVGIRPGKQTTGEQHAVTHGPTSRMNGRARHGRLPMPTDMTTVKGRAASNDTLRANAFSKPVSLTDPLPFSETISGARTLNDRIIQHLITGRIDAASTGGGAARTIGGPVDTATLVQGIPQQVTAAGGSQSIPATLAAATSSGASLSGSINAPFGSEQWQQVLARQSLRLSHSGGGHARLTLHPPSLGTLHVSLQLGNQAQIHFASPHAEVRAAVNSALPQLKDAFAEAGIDLGQTSVWDDPQQFGAHDGDRRDRKNLGRASNAVEESSEIDTQAMQITRITGRTAEGGVDIFA